MSKGTTKLGVLLVLLAFLVMAPSAMAWRGGDSNHGDAWVDNVGQPPGPGHEMDPHLECSDINLWGSYMADSSGSYTINGWPPSGSQEQVYTSTWHYSSGKSSQVMDVINVKTLIANAVAHGDTPHPVQGFHFKLELSQDPHKHKTFWVKCPMPAPKPPVCESCKPKPPPGPPPCGYSCTPVPPVTPPNPCTGSSCSPAPTCGYSCTPKPPLKKLGPPIKKKGRFCPRVVNQRFHVSFSPQRIAHGKAHYHAWASPKRAVIKIVTTIFGVGNSHRWTHVSHGASSAFTVDVGDSSVWGTTFIGSTNVGPYGQHKVRTTFYLRCGKKTVTTHYFNNDPPGR